MNLLKKGLRYRIHSLLTWINYILILEIIFSTILSLILFIGFISINYFTFATILGIAYIISMIVLIALFLWVRKIHKEGLIELDNLQNGTDKVKMEQLEYLINKKREK